MHAQATRLSGPIVFEPTVHGDARGFFVETFRASILSRLGIEETFVQDNHSRSRAGVTRGMHFQAGQAKLVRCANGAIIDVIVDIRAGSPQFGQWEAFRLDDESHRMLYVPDGFAHGFSVLSEVADVTYKVSSYYDAAAENGFRFDDPDVGIEWPTEVEQIVSDRDRAAPTLAELASSLPFSYT